MKSFLALVAALAAAALVAFPAAAATSVVVYDNTPHPLPGNLPSWAFEATGASEFGDRVGLAAGAARTGATVTVVLSSWGCQAGYWYSGDCVTAPGAVFTHPITLNLYAVGVGNAPGALLGTVTQTFAIPYRPSADPVNCTGANAGKWFDGTTCFNGKATTITFSLAALNLTLPDELIVSVAYNTTHYGYAPIGAAAPCYSGPGGCPYDSLNVALADPATTLSAGTNPAPDDAYQYTDYSSCANGPIHPFGLDAGCWTGFKPAIQITAVNPLVGPPTDKKQCKNGGWKQFNNPSFSSQKACEKFVKQHKDDDDDEHGDHGDHGDNHGGSHDDD
jgi:hypothetical protein